MSRTAPRPRAATDPPRDRAEPVPAAPLAPGTWWARLNAYLLLETGDRLLLGGLLLVAFVLRFFSPIFPDFFAHPFEGSPISNCVQHTPVDAAGHDGVLCGLAYPFQRGSQPTNPAEKPTPPEGEVFDEIYFGVDAHNDLKGISYFDPEPPFAKLMIASGEWTWGWFRATFLGASGSYADLGFNTFGWRLASVFFGTLTVPLMYLLAFRLWRNRLFAAAAGILTCFDGMFFVQSRIGMIDMVPIFLILLTYFCFHLHLDSRTEKESLRTLLLTGTVLGFAIASKWIALAALGTMLMFLGFRVLGPHLGFSVQTPTGSWSWRPLGEGRPRVPGAVPMASYLAVGAIAFVLIPILIYLVSWTPFFMRGQFHGLGDLIRYQQDSYWYHANLKATHTYGSPWYSWPFLYRPVAYYFESAGLGIDSWSKQPLAAGMTDMGNPFIWWASIPCLLALPYFIFRHRSYPAAFIAVGFISQYLPWARITRVIFLYHMFGGLPFMILALAFVLARIGSSEAELRMGALFLAARGRELVYVYLAVVVLAFAYFYPVWTALPISYPAYIGQSFSTDPDHEPHLDGKMWFRSWI